MDKLLHVFGICFFVGMVKMREWLDNLTGLIKGDDGFVLVLGICGAAILVSAVVLLTSGRPKAKASS